MFFDAFRGTLENIEILRQEFSEDVLHPDLSHGILILKPFPESGIIYVYCERPGAVREFSVWTKDTVEKRKLASPDQLVTTVYEYLQIFDADTGA